jgi:hypothetical protein
MTNSHVHFTENELIAYQLHDSPDAKAIRLHLEACTPCAELSESIAETLRVFSAEPVPEANLEHNWQRLRGSLPILHPVRKQSRWLDWRWIAPTAGLAAVAALLLLDISGVRLHHAAIPSTEMAIKSHGPLTDTPVDPPTGASIATHLDTAERLLTEVNHTTGPLDPTTRESAHNLLLSNAVYVQSARQQGNFAQASVLEDLGRVLTTLDHEPEHSDDAVGWHIRLSMNTNGLLFDIRILRQNDQRQ